MGTKKRGRLARMPGSGIVRIVWNGLQRKLAVHGNVALGVGTTIGQGSIVSATHSLTIGDRVHIGRNCTIEVNGSIGDCVLMAANVGIVGRNDHATDEPTIPMRDATWIGDRLLTGRDVITIGSDVWIGYGAVLLSGIEVGSGAVIAAGSVVTRDVPESAVVAGNPAVVKGYRFGGGERKI